MAKVTSKLQVTVPKALAERYDLEPGDEITWEAAGDVIRVVPPRKRPAKDVASRLRQEQRAAGVPMADRRPLLLRALNRLYAERGVEVEATR